MKPQRPTNPRRGIVFVFAALSACGAQGLILAGHHYVKTAESHGLRQKEDHEPQWRVKMSNHLALFGSLIILAHRIARSTLITLELDATSLIQASLAVGPSPA